MKKLSAILALASLLPAARAALPQPDLIAQIHFAGPQKIFADANAAAIKDEFCSAEAVALRAQTAGKLSVWLAGWLQKNNGVNVPDGAAKLRPLLDDLQKTEWFAESRVAPNGKIEAAIAVKLDAATAAQWQNSLKLFFPASSCKTAGGWLIFDSDPALLKLGDSLAQKISAPPTAWANADVNWPRLAQWFPKLKELALPETQFAVTASNANFHIAGKFLFPENLAIKLDPWRVPTNTIHIPFDSFTAARGFAGGLKSQPWAQALQISPTPNQIVTWSLSPVAFQMFAAIPAPDADSALSQAYAQIAPEINAANARDDFIMPVRAQMGTNQISFTGLPWVAPNLKALKEPAGQFLFLETFPNAMRRGPLPPELFRRLETPNLVFYHWEITSERMTNWLQLSQFALMVTRHKQIDANSAAFKWLKKTGPALGPTDTEITQSGPAEFTFTRKTSGVFTALELYALANWLEATNFPGCDLKLPPRPPRLKQQRQQQFQLTTPGPAGH